MAQPKKKPVPVIRSINDIHRAVYYFYQPNQDSLKNVCWAGCMFVRFTADSTRQFTKIAFSGAPPPFVKDALMNSFDQINAKGLTVIQLNNSMQKTYILPVIIGHNEGCGFRGGFEDRSVKRDPKMDEIYKERQKNYDQGITSLWNMMKFSDGEADSISGILLTPLKFGFTMY